MIRSARISDVPEVQRLINHFAEKDEMLPRSLNAIYEDIRDFYVMEEDGSIIGCCALHISWSDLAEIRSLAIDEHLQKKGFGKKLMEQCLAEARDLGISRVFALTYAVGFFEKLGFHKADKAALPRKIWSDCINCPKFPNCSEEAVVKDI